MFNKTLYKINETHYLDLGQITGIMKVDKGYRLLLGPLGTEFPQTFRTDSIKTILNYVLIQLDSQLFDEILEKDT